MSNKQSDYSWIDRMWRKWVASFWGVLRRKASAMPIRPGGDTLTKQVREKLVVMCPWLVSTRSFTVHVHYEPPADVSNYERRCSLVWYGHEIPDPKRYGCVVHWDARDPSVSAGLIAWGLTLMAERVRAQDLTVGLFDRWAGPERTCRVGSYVEMPE